MLLDVNTVLGSRASGKRGLCSCYSSVFWIYSCTLAGHFQSECSIAIDSVSLISFKAQIPHPILIRASGRPGLVQAWVSIASFATRNLQPGAEQIVTAVIPHALAQRVQTLATCDLFLWQHNQLFLLDFFANTVLRRSVLVVRVLYFIENKLIPHRI